MNTNIALLPRAAGIAAATIFLLTSPAAAEKPTRIEPNDNRTPAGELRDGVLHLQLEISRGSWYPESEDGESIPTYAFREVGKPLQVPGPTIRVPQSTTIEISARNSLSVPVTLHGLYARPGDDGDRTLVEPGATARIRFEAGEPGVYPYWGRTPDGGQIANNRNRILDAMLGGAFVVDPPGTDPMQDRIFVLERWNGAQRTAINGKSWPFTERLEAEVGKEERWKVLNVSDLSHPMHLHGFHFWLNAEGDGKSYETLDEGERREEFTHSADVMETFEISWTPHEPGRWLYHCHRMPHMRLPVPLDPELGDIPQNVPEHEDMEAWDSGFAGMGGMILGITVTGPRHFDTETDWRAERRIELDVSNRDGISGLYEIELKDLNGEEEPARSTGLTGPLLLVTKDQPTEITVVNESQAATSVHWHGQEIESYYDGVPWWSGIGEKRAPLVEPGHRFRVKLIPQRTGSFIYHAHWHDGDQLNGGIQGAMIVLPPGGTYDPDKDKYFIMSLAPREIFGGAVLLVNGWPQPASPLRFRVGETYRLRFMNITPTVDALRMSLSDESGFVQWRPIAKDAADIEGAGLQMADQQVAVGETFDVEYQAEKAGELRLEARATPDAVPRFVQTILAEDK